MSPASVRGSRGPEPTRLPGRNALPEWTVMVRGHVHPWGCVCIAGSE